MEGINTDIIQWGIFFCLIFIVMKFYWLTVLFLAVILFTWGIISLLAPLYLSFNHFSDGKNFIGIVTMLVSIPILVPCLIAYHAAWKWVKREMNNKVFFRKWNALNF